MGGITAALIKECTYLDSMQNILELIEHIRAEHKVFRDVKDIGKDIMVTCPFHLDGMEDTPSLGIHKETGKYNCFACGAKGNLVKLISEVTGMEYNSAEQWLEENSDFEINTRGDLLHVELDESNPMEWERTNDDLIRACRYLESRGIKNSLDVASRFHIGGDASWFKIGIRRPNGDVRYIKSRSLHEKRFLNTKGVDKANHLFGLYEAIVAYGAGHELWVCESELDAMAVWSDNTKCAVAFGGALFSDRQLNMILQWLRPRVIIDGFDKDEAGRKAWKEFVSAYMKLDPTVVIQTTHSVDDCKDITDYLVKFGTLDFMKKDRWKYDKNLNRWYKEVPYDKLKEELWLKL